MAYACVKFALLSLLLTGCQISECGFKLTHVCEKILHIQYVKAHCKFSGKGVDWTRGRPPSWNETYACPDGSISVIPGK